MLLSRPLPALCSTEEARALCAPASGEVRVERTKGRHLAFVSPEPHALEGDRASQEEERERPGTVNGEREKEREREREEGRGGKGRRPGS